jgi:spermidine synthase
MRKIEPIIGLIIVFSCMCSALYEVLWTRQLILFFGSPVFAVSTVLSALIGGLGLGSFYFGRLAHEKKQLLRQYALLGAGLGIFALIFPILLDILNAICVLIYRGLGAGFHLLSVIRFVLSFFLLLIPSALIGGALLLLGRSAKERCAGFRADRLFTINILSASIGSIVAGFFLVQLLGVQNSVYLGVAVNLILAGIAFGLDRSWSETPADLKQNVNDEPEISPTGEMWRPLVWTFTVAGFCTTAYAVLWTRILTSFLGNPVYAFSVTLTTLLFGISVGNFLFAAIARRIQSFVNLFGLVQIGVGLSVVAVMPAFGNLYGISRELQAAFGVGRVWEFAAGFILMIIPSLLMGASCPLIRRICAAAGSRSVVYSFGTIGGLLGSLCAGIILIPLIGLRPSVLLTAGLNTVVGCLLILRNAEKSQLFSGTAIGGTILTVGVGLMALLWGSSPAFLKNGTFWMQRLNDTLVEHTETVDANITTFMDDQGVHRTYVDNDQIADTTRRGSVPHRILAHLPLLLHPNPERGLVLGFGMGITSHTMTQYGVRVDALENPNGLIEVARKHFSDVNHNVVDSSLFNHSFNDERSYVLMTPKRYDVIATGTTHPLVSSKGSNLYSADFYRWCKRILTEDGIICQWVPLNQLPEPYLKTVVRTFIEVFPTTTIWYKYTPDFVVLIGTPDRLKINYRRFMERTQIPRVQAALVADDVDGLSLLDSFMMSDKVVRAYAGDAGVHTDNRPRLEFFHPRALVNTTHKNIEGLARHRERSTPYLVNYGGSMSDKIEVRKQIDLYFDATQKLIEGQIEYAKGEYEKAVGILNQAVAVNPDDNTIRSNLGDAVGLANKDYQEELKQTESSLKQALRSNPQDVQKRVELGITYELQGELAKAADAFEEALKYDPNRPELYSLLGPIYERQERYDDALRTYQRLEKLEPNLPAIIFGAMASIYHFHKKMLPEALKYAEKALAADADSWRVQNLLGVIYTDQKEFDEAIEAFKAAMQLAPNEPMPHSDMAKAYLAQGKYDESLKSVEAAMRLAPRDPYLQEQRRQIQAAIASSKE